MTLSPEVSEKPELTEFFTKIVPISLEAAKLALSHFNQNPQYRIKSDGSPVTVADEAIEKLIFERINELYPEDGFFGEEGNLADSASGRKWIVDPIDGTIQFIRGQEFWSTLIALDDKTETLASVINFPVRGELIYAEKGKGCWIIDKDGYRRLKVSSVNNLEDAYVLHNGVEFARQAGIGAQLSQLLKKVHAERGYADAFGHVEVIRGRSDIMIDCLTEYHDIVAIKIAVEEAGGRWSPFDESFDMSSMEPHPGSITTNSLLHSKVLGILNHKNT